MSDLLLLILILVTLGNVFNLIYAKTRMTFYRLKFKKTEKLTYQSADCFYEGKKDQKELKSYFLYNGAFFSLLCTLVSNSIADFILSMSIILMQYYILFNYYKKQKPLFYLHEKGITCVMIAPIVEKNKFGMKGWREITHYNDSMSHVYIAGKNFEFELPFQQETGIQFRVFLKKHINKKAL